MIKRFITIALLFSAGAIYAQNVGIGTNTPGSKLDVKGNLSVGAGVSGYAAPTNGAIIEGKVAIGTATVHANSVLDIKASDKGIQLPNIALTGPNSPIAGTKPDGLLVYNTSTTGAYPIPGIYVWNATSGDWVRTITSATLSSSLQPLTNSVGGGLTTFSYNGGTATGIGVATNGITSSMIGTGEVQTSDILDGTISSADMGANSVDLSSNVVTNLLPVNRGGTGVGSLSAGRMFYGDGTNPLQSTNTPIGGQVLVANSSNVPAFQTLSGDATISNTGVLTLKNTGTAGVYGSATQVPVLTTDAQGRITGVTNTTITGVSTIGSALNSANIIVGNASNQAAAVAMSGDVTISNTGVTSIGTGKVTSAMILDGTVSSADIADGTVASVDITDGSVASVDIADGTVASIDIADGTVASVDITDGTITANDLAATGVTAGTYPKVTVNAQGQVTGGSALAAGDIPAGSGNYIQNQSSSAQSANSWINGTERANTVRSNSGSGGYAQLNAGNTTNSGFVSFHKSDGTTRLGYIGWDNTNVTYVTENSASHVFSGTGAVISNIDMQAREGLYTKKSYYYATYGRHHNYVGGTGASTYGLGSFDFCALAGQSTLIDEDDGDQTADVQCNIYTNSGSQPAWGDGNNGAVATMNYDYASRPYWYMYVEVYGSKWWADITCNAICINFDY